jgi:hypothetical protein
LRGAALILCCERRCKNAKDCQTRGNRDVSAKTKIHSRVLLTLVVLFFDVPQRSAFSCCDFPRKDSTISLSPLAAIVPQTP